MNLFLDDQKIPEWFSINPASVVVARTTKNALRILRANKLQLDTLYLDHDLGEGPSGYEFLYEAIQKSIVPKRVVIISLNYAGRKRIEALCNEHDIPYTTTFPNVPTIEGTCTHEYSSDEASAPDL